MKPSWDDAPEWAEWLAMDSDGGWYFHEVEPFWDQADGCWYGREVEETEIELGGYDETPENIDPSSTLEGRH